MEKITTSKLFEKFEELNFSGIPKPNKYLLCTYFGKAGPSIGLCACHILCEVNADENLPDKEEEFLARLKILCPEMWVSIPAEHTNRLNLHLGKSFFFQYAVIGKIDTVHKCTTIGR